MRMPRFMSTRLVVTSSPSTTIPGVTYASPSPISHVLVLVVARVRVLERAPAAELDAPVTDLLVARHRFVEEVEDVVVHRDGLLDEVYNPHKPAQVVGEDLGRRHRARAARVDRRGVDVPALHQAEH